MKKYINTAMVYAIAALASGVFYREFTRFNGVAQGAGALGLVHTHLFMLGMVFFLLLAALEGRLALTKQPRFGLFYGLYNGGLALTAAALFARGVMDVLLARDPLGVSPEAYVSVSYVAGVGHIVLAAGLILGFVLLRRATREA